MDQTQIRTKLEQIRRLMDMGIVYLDYERILEFHYRRWVKPGDTVIDIGAHIGRHLQPLMESIGDDGKVIAFEPIPFAYAELINHFKQPNVSINNVALSNYEGNSEFTLAEGAPEESGLLQRAYNSPTTTTPVKITTRVDKLDNFTQGISKLSFIKIDIEGGELNCLHGAQKTILRHRPVISVEYGEAAYSVYGNTADTLFEFAQANQYVVYDILLNPLDTLEEWRDSVNYVYWDFILVPQEKVAEFEARVVSSPKEKMPHPNTNMIAIERHESILQAIECRVGVLENNLHAATSALEQSRTMLGNVLESSSWKLTAPIRLLVNMIKGK